MEAPGIEPGSRGTAKLASTCVAKPCPKPTVWLPRVRRAGPRLAGCRRGYRSGFFSRRGPRIGPVAWPSFARDPELASEPQPLWRRVRNGLRGFTPPGRTAFQQLNFDRLFTRPTDQPRHAAQVRQLARSKPTRPRLNAGTIRRAGAGDKASDEPMQASGPA